MRAGARCRDAASGIVLDQAGPSGSGGDSIVRAGDGQVIERFPRPRGSSVGQRLRRLRRILYSSAGCQGRSARTRCAGYHRRDPDLALPESPRHGRPRDSVRNPAASCCSLRRYRVGVRTDDRRHRIDQLLSSPGFHDRARSPGDRRRYGREPDLHREQRREGPDRYSPEWWRSASGPAILVEPSGGIPLPATPRGSSAGSRSWMVRFGTCPSMAFSPDWPGPGALAASPVAAWPTRRRRSWLQRRPLRLSLGVRSLLVATNVPDAVYLAECTPDRPLLPCPAVRSLPRIGSLRLSAEGW
jgi:hypothetical protein